MDRRIIDERLDRLVDIRNSLDQVIDTLPVKVPVTVRESLKGLLFNNEELNQLIQDIVDRRPPRLIVIGKTGVGKSSLINAMFGRYLAKTSAVDIGTKSVASYQYRDGDQTLFDVIDTRGLNESRVARNSAEQALKEAMHHFEPDAVILVMDATDRAGMDEELKQVHLLKPLISQHVPIVCVLTHADHIEPARVKEPERYPEVKEARIKEKRTQVKQLIFDLNLPIGEVIPVSSYIEWSHDAPETLTSVEQKYLTIDFDGRYQMDELLDYLASNIDF